MNRLKKILKWTGIILGMLVAVVLVANAAFVWITDARLERQLAEIRAAGDPVTLTDLARPPIPPEQNAATYLRQAEADAEAIETEIEATDVGPQLDSRKFPWPPQVQKVLKSALDAHPNVIPLLERAAACPDYYAQLDYAVPADEFIEKQLIPLPMKVRTVARVLRYRGRLLLAEGNRDDAVRTSLVLLRLADHLERNPSLLMYFVSLTFRYIAVDTANLAMQTGPVSEDVRVALDAELAVQERMEGFALAMRSELPMIVDCLPTTVHGIPRSNVWFVGRGVWNMQKSAYLDVFPTLMRLAREPVLYRDIAREIGEEEENSIMARLLFPGLRGAYRCVASTRAEIRCLRILNAFQTHVPPESNEAPNLTDLGLPAETTTDPFAGEPLHVKKTPQGWLIYSVGANFQDDGGRLDDNSDVGIAPPPPAAESR